MKIGLIAMKAGTAAGGLATYELSLIRALASIDRVNSYHVLCVAPVDPAVFGISQENFTFHVLRPRNRAINMSWSAARLMRRLDLDLYHIMFLPVLGSRLPFVLTAHGEEMFIDPKFFPWRIRVLLVPLMRWAYSRASFVVCCSGAIQKYVLEHFPQHSGRSIIGYNGCADIFKPAPRETARDFIKSRLGLHEPYLLFVGRIEPRKNPLRVLQAFAEFRRETNSETKLVMAGGQTWSAGQAQDLIQELGLESAVVRAGHVRFEELPLLYSGAEMLVFPSLWEGFGLPLVEAMRCGCPTITSTVSCLPEIAGGASLLVNPQSVDEIAAAMIRLHQDTALAAELRAKGLARSAEFTWKRTAEAALKAYEALASESQAK